MNTDRGKSGKSGERELGRVGTVGERTHRVVGGESEGGESLVNGDGGIAVSLLSAIRGMDADRAWVARFIQAAESKGGVWQGAPYGDAGSNERDGGYRRGGE